MKNKNNYIFLLCVLFSLSFVLASNGILVVKFSPLDSGGNPMPSTFFNDTLNFTTDSACNSVVFSSGNFNFTTNSEGTQNVSITIPSSLSNIPSYICEYRNGSNLRGSFEIPSSFVNQLFVIGVNSSSNIYSGGNITTNNYGFFGWIGSNVNSITKGWFTNLQVNQNINSTNVTTFTVNSTGTVYAYNNNLSTGYSLSTNNTFAPVSEPKAYNGTLVSWLGVSNGTIALNNGTFVSWLQMMNGTMVNYSNLNNGTYLTSNTTWVSWLGITNGTVVLPSVLNNGTYTTWLALGNGTYVSAATLNNGSYVNTNLVNWLNVNNGTISDVNKVSWLNVGNGTIPTTNSIWTALSNGTVVLTSTLNNGTYTTWLGLGNGTYVSAATLNNGTYNGNVSGTGTVGYIPQWSGTNTLNNSGIYQNGSNVGIGTTSPGSLLDVEKNVDSNQLGFVRFLNPGATTAGRYTSMFIGKSADSGGSGEIGYYSDTATPTNAGLFLNNYGDSQTTQSLFIKQGGNVGIGTATPRNKLTVAAIPYAVSQTGGIRLESAGGEHFGDINITTDAGGNPRLAISPPAYGGTSEAFTILNTGNVGIGTTSPSRLLQIEGAGSTAGLKININSTQQLFNLLPAGSTNPDNLDAIQQMYSNNVEKIRLYTNGDSFFNGGNVGIGTQTPYSKLHVYGGSTEPNLTVGTAATAVFTSSLGNELEITNSGSSPYGIALQGRNFVGNPSGVSYPILLNPLGGNVGIGLTNPMTKFYVLTTTANDQAVTGSITATTGTNYAGVFSATGSGATTNIGGHFTATGATNNYGLIVADGNVGIGTTTPQDILHVKGTAPIQAKISDSDSSSVGLDLGYSSSGSTNAYIMNRYNGNTASAINFGFATPADNNLVMSLYATGNMELSESVNKTPTVLLSGSLFISGGACWYKGFAGTYTKIANS